MERRINVGGGGGWEAFPKQKVFISFCEADRTYMGAMRNRLMKRQLLEPLVVESRHRPSVDLTDIIHEAINDADYFLVILTESSKINQWVNQEIGFAFARPKLEGKRFAFVEDKILHDLKGFFHDKMQHPYLFKHRAFSTYYRHCENLINEIEQRVINEYDIQPV